MGRIIGLGGVFIKARDPKALAAWYEKHLKISFNGTTYSDLPFKGEDGKPGPGSNVLSFFPMNSEYYQPSTSPVMLNLRVSGLIELQEELKQSGVVVVGEPMVESYGKFGWILDGEGNKVELWEPTD